jgi:hypothetical protein
MSYTAGPIADLLRDSREEALELMADRATVYGLPPGGRTYTEVLKTDLRCSLQAVDVRPVSNVGGRDELSRRRLFLWDGGYVMPNDVWVQVNGTVDRFSVVRSSIVGFPAGQTLPVYFRADLVRQTGINP